MKLKFYLLTLLGLSASLCFGAGRTTMHNSPRRSQLASPQLRSPSAPRHQSFLNLFSASQKANQKPQNTSDDDNNVSLGRTLQETFKKLAHEILDKNREIRQYQKNESYSEESLLKFKGQLEDFQEQLEEIDSKHTSQKIREGHAALMSTLEQDLEAVDEMLKRCHQAEATLPWRTDGLTIPARERRSNQVKRGSPAASKPELPMQEPLMYDISQKKLTDLTQAPQLTDSGSIVIPAREKRSNQVEMSFSTASTPEPPMYDISQKKLTNLKQTSLIYLQHPSFVKRYWKLMTACGLLLGGGLVVNAQKKYKFLTRLAHFFTK